VAITTARHRHGPQLDLFIPYIADLPLRDTRETMERPFFSLAKRKRLKPIEYTSPDGTIYVKVFATPQFGMATIWDADILIWASSTLNNMRNQGCNDLPRTLNFQAYDLLKTIGRDTGGRDYQLLRDALGRLQATTIRTNIRPKGRKKERQFSWIESWSDLVDENTGKSLGMSLTVSDWFYEGILMEGSRSIPCISRSRAGASAGFTASPASMRARRAPKASPFRCRPCSRNPARKAPIAVSNSRCWPSSTATISRVSSSASRRDGSNPPSACSARARSRRRRQC